MVLLLATVTIHAQQGINYKAIISDNGAVLQNQVVQVQFSLLTDGLYLNYQETHSTTTDANGIIILNIGEGTAVSGLYNSIDWDNQLYLKVEIDTGNGYVDFGTTAFKTVPYAIYAENGNGAKKLGELTDVNADITSLYLGIEAGDSETDSNLDNTTIGSFTLRNNLTGRGNNAMGFGALYKNGGDNNVANGVQSLNSNTTGNNNTAIGAFSLFENITGSENTVLGNRAGYKNLGSGNIFIGNKAGYNEVESNKLYIENSDSDTPLIGGDFSSNIVTINGSLAIVDGTEALGKVLTSNANGLTSWQEIDIAPTTLNNIEDVIYSVSTSNLFIGKAGNTTATGSSNNAIGYGTLVNLSTGKYNNAFGYASLNSNTIGTGNSSYGQYSNFSNTTGDYNTGIGYGANYNNKTGSFNTSIGSYSGLNSTGSNNIFLGYRAGQDELGNNKLYIENSNSSKPLIGGDFDTDEVTINGELNVTTSITGNIEGNITAIHSGDADMKAYLFGSVALDGNTFESSSSNGFSSSKISTGHYSISSTGLNYYTVTATMRYGFIGFITVEKFANEFRVKTYNTSGVAEDRGFDFVVFKR